jgi:hypothetical protein
MSSYRIVCVEKTASADGTHKHLSGVGTGIDPDSASTKRTVSEVRAAIDNGDTFHTVGANGQKANVEKWSCCGVNTLRTKPDDTKTDNLDNLRLCSWKQ